MKLGKGTQKEKEHLYEETIKLKIQANSHKEENVKLKTKIKILENEILKKEKAMEDLFTQSYTMPKQTNSNQNLPQMPQQSTQQKI